MTVKDITATDIKTFLPEQPKKGHIGFFPCKPKEWRDLPLPLRCTTSYPINGKFVAAVVFDVWFNNYGFSGKVESYPQNVFKVLFSLSDVGTQLYTDIGVRWNDGSRSGAKWWQDNQTGAYRISTICGITLLKQGGFQGHVPENCKYDEAEGRWQMENNNNAKIKTYFWLL